MHQKFRDYAKLSDKIIRRLGLGSSSIVIDIGSGIGAFTLNAARKCRTIYAVDTSAEMLEYCREHAESQGLFNIVFCHGGLLTHEHVGDLADAIVCVAGPPPAGFLEAGSTQTVSCNAQAWRQTICGLPGVWPINEHKFATSYPKKNK